MTVRLTSRRERLETLTKAFTSVKDGVESVVSLGYKEFDIPLNGCDGADALFQEFHSFFNEKEKASLVVARARFRYVYTEKISRGLLSSFPLTAAFL